MIADNDGAPATLLEVGETFLGDADLSFDAYTSQAIYVAEVERVWGKTWQWACREEAIPEPGDWTVYDVAHYSVLIVRQMDRTVRAFVNSCPHRGMQFADSGSSGHGKQFIRCPFHGMQWHLDGSLREIPCRWDFPHIRDDSFGLTAVRVASWGGFVFINLDPEAPSLKAYLDVLPRHFAHAPLDRRRVSIHIAKVMPGNWKMCIEAFLEAFHVLATHPEGARYTADAAADYDVLGPHVSRFMHSLGIPSSHLKRHIAEPDVVADVVADMGFDPAGLKPGQSARAYIADAMRAAFGAQFGIDYSNTSTAEILDSVQYFVFPNAFFFPGVLLRMVYRFRPIDPDHCLFEILVLDPLPDGVPVPPPAPVVALAANETYEGVPGFRFGQVFDQDTENFRRQTAGIKASAKGRQTLGNCQEVRVRHLRQTLAIYLNQLS